MNDCERLALELERALEGAAWHGPSWREALEGVDSRTAALRPIPAAHTIAELVGHTALWLDVVRRRLEGESPQVPDDQDWRPSTPADEKEWHAAIAASLASGHALVETVRRFPLERLYEPRPKVDSSYYELISGELQHLLYHAGQVTVLKKAGAVH